MDYLHRIVYFQPWNPMKYRRN